MKDTAHQTHPPPQDTDVTLTPETLSYLEAAMSSAVKRGIEEAMTEEMALVFWGAGLRVLQKQASEHTGRFVIGGLWGLARKAGVFLVLGGLVYAMGGWSALSRFWHVLWGAS